MANGNDALAAGMDILTGDEDRRDGWDEINLTRDYIAQRTSAIQPVAKGGTGADNAAGARANLDVVGWADTYTDPVAGVGKIPRFNSAGQLPTLDPTAPAHCANKRYVDDHAGVPATGGTFTGPVYFPNATPATSGYVVAYLNSDGRLSRGASSERYKENVEPVDPADLGDIWPTLHRYQMIDGDGTWKTGYIAERLAENADQDPYVVYAEFAGQLVPESIDFIGLLIAQNAQLHEQLAQLTQRVTDLEAGHADS